MSNTGIGARIERTEDKRFITGNGRYTDDINLPGQVYASFVRSPHAHAKVTGIDAKDALALKGVVKVFTGKDMEADGLGGLICGWTVTSKDGEPMKVGGHPSLAPERVRYVGDCVAVVIGESREAARLGAEAVAVSYEELDAVVEPAQAQNQNAPKVHEDIDKNLCFHWELGDKEATDAAFDKAAHVTHLDIVNNRLIPNAIEPRAALGDYNPGSGDYTLYTTSQNPHVERLVLSAFVGVAPEHKLRVISPDVGGGFGSKIFVYAEETVCLWAAGKIQRPVKWTAERSESFLSDAHGRDHVTRAELALDGDGRFLALRAHTVANLGAYLSTFSSSVPTYLYGTLLSGQYDIAAIHVEVEGVYTHTAPVDAYRGAGRPEATFVVERLVERAARETNKDPAELRKKNFVTKFPHQTPVILNYDTGDYNACIDRASEMIDYKSFDKRRKEAQAKGKLRGIGFSTYIEACGLAPSNAVGSLGAGVGLWESAEVRVNPTGNVEVLTGAHSHGQGHETSFAQLVSDRLTIPIEDITIVHGDTASV
ncbi:MAG: xanthine dehydrogenase family protein molybdopterin-binding subunit, partial [Hyphomicrobiales bacterium]|nr:xanthine dehydrogenase family protein molybdopterin-binding subunit [Hyphomicrobiales bacterium]